MPQPSQRQRAAICLALSAILHLVVACLVYLTAPVQLEYGMYRVRATPSIPQPPQRHTPRPPVVVPQITLERLRAEGDLMLADHSVEATDTLAAPSPEAPSLVSDTLATAVGAKGEWVGGKDTLRPHLQLVDHVTELPPVDWAEWDAMGRRHTVAVVDPVTGKLVRASFHVPMYRNSPPSYHGARDLTETLDLIHRGFRLPNKAPIVFHIDYRRLGIPADPRHFEKPDPIHNFSGYPSRHILAYQEMIRYGVLLARYIDVESTSAMVRYLLQGGFAIVSGRQLSIIQAALRDSLPEGEVERVAAGLDHPLFRAYYDIPRYAKRQHPQCCFGIYALPGIEVNGRMVAIVSPGFCRLYQCRSNKLYVNVLAWALIQPSPMGGRYLAR